MLEFVILSESEYQEFQIGHPCANFMNDVESLHLKSIEGWEVEYVGVRRDGVLLCATPLASIPVMKVYRYYYAQRGFLMDFGDKELVSFFTKELKSYLKTKRGLYLQMDPNVLYKERDIDGNIVEDGFDHSYVVENLIENGYIHHGLNVGYVNLQVRWIFSLYLQGKNEKQILKECHQQTRWSINKTIKQGIQVRELGVDEIDIFLKMMDETSIRRGFEARDHVWYRQQMETFGSKGKMLLAYLDLTAFKKSLALEKEDLSQQKRNIEEKLAAVPNSKKFIKKQRVVNEALDLNEKKTMEADQLETKYGSVLHMATSYFLVTDGEVVYMHSATDDTFRKYNAPYAIQWYMIRYAIKHKINRYNFYGISGIFDPDDESYGVYDFKRGFNGVVEELVGEFILPIHENAYRMYKRVKK